MLIRRQWNIPVKTSKLPADGSFWLGYLVDTWNLLDNSVWHDIAQGDSKWWWWWSYKLIKKGGAQVIRAKWSACWQSGGPKFNIHPDWYWPMVCVLPVGILKFGVFHLKYLSQLCAPSGSYAASSFLSVCLVFVSVICHLFFKFADEINH